MKKYLQHCPKCSEKRRKSHLKTCSVLEFENGYSLKCFHCNHKEFIRNKESFVLEGDAEEITALPQDIDIPEGELPFVDPSIIFHKYYNKGRCRLIIVRKGSGKDKWIRPFILTNDGWFMGTVPDKMLYRSESLSKDDRPVIVVEGEKAADSAAKIFSKADIVTWRGGAQNYESGDWSLLEGRTVVLWPDNDDAGVEVMRKISELIKAKEMFIVDVSSLPAKADLADDIDLNTISDLYKSKVKITRKVLKGAVKGEDFLHLYDKRLEGYSFGFSNMDAAIRYPERGLVVVSGRTNHGKSLLMVNMAANLLRNTDAVVMYLSYELSAAETGLRFIKALHNTQYSDKNFIDDQVYYEKIQAGEVPEAREIAGYMNEDRFILTDESIQLNEVIDTMELLGRLGKRTVIFVDYLQLIPIESGQSRYLEIKKIVESLRQVALRNGHVLVGGSQLTEGETHRQDQAREGKDIAFTASLVLKIWNKVTARVTGATGTRKNPETKEMEEVDHYGHIPGDFVVEVVKTRQGQAGKCFGFNVKNGNKLEEADKMNGAF